MKDMKTKMVGIWRPIIGINIKEIKSGLFLFQFYHKDDLVWVQKGGPWSFDNTLLVFNNIALAGGPM